MDLTNLATALVDEGVNIWTADRIRRADGADLIPSDVLNWSVYVYDGRTLVYSLTGQPNTSPPFFTSLHQPDGYSSKPYNFRHVLPGTAWTQKGGKVYDIRYQIQTTQFGMIPLNRLISVKPSPVA